MLKKIVLAVIVIGIGVLCYTEHTGKTDLGKVVSALILGEDAEQQKDEQGYSIVKEDAPLSAADQAIQDANDYHKDANNFANGTNKTVNKINEAAK